MKGLVPRRPTWKRVELLGLQLTGLLTLIVGLGFAVTGFRIENPLTLPLEAVGLTVAAAGILMSLRVRDDLVAVILSGASTATFAVVLVALPTLTSSAAFAPPVYLAGCLLGFLAFRGGYQKESTSP